MCDILSTNYRCIIPDLPGFGASSPLKPPVTIANFAEVLFSLLEKSGINDKIVLYGLSMGGYIAMEFAARYPERLAGLILSNTRTSADSPDVVASRRRLANSLCMAEAAEIPSLMAKTADGMLPYLLSADTQKNHPEIVQFVRDMIIRQPEQGVAAAARAIASRRDTTEVLASLRCPVQLICAEEDRPSPPAAMRSLLKILQNGYYAEISNAGHLTPLEATLSCSTLVSRFMRKITV